MADGKESLEGSSSAKNAPLKPNRLANLDKTNTRFGLDSVRPISNNSGVVGVNFGLWQQLASDYYQHLRRFGQRQQFEDQLVQHIQSHLRLLTFYFAIKLNNSGLDSRDYFNFGELFNLRNERISISILELELLNQIGMTTPHGGSEQLIHPLPFNFLLPDNRVITFRIPLIEEFGCQYKIIEANQDLDVQQQRLVAGVAEMFDGWLDLPALGVDYPYTLAQYHADKAASTQLTTAMYRDFRGSIHSDFRLTSNDVSGSCSQLTISDAHAVWTLGVLDNAHFVTGAAAGWGHDWAVMINNGITQWRCSKRCATLKLEVNREVCYLHFLDTMISRARSAMSSGR